MAVGLVLGPEYYIPCGLLLASLAIPPRPLSRRFTQLAIMATACTLAATGALRFADLLWSLRTSSTTSWDTSIEAVAAAWLNGQSLYATTSDGYFYGLIYGPLLYEILAFGQWLTGIGHTWSKFPMVFAEVAAVILTWRAARRTGISWKVSTVATGVMVAELGMLKIGGVRSDQLLLLCAAAALTVAPAAIHRRRSAFWLGLCGGLATSLKFTAFCYILPALLPIACRSDVNRRRIFSWLALGCIAGALTPYLLPGAGITASAFLEVAADLRLMPGPAGLSFAFSLIALLPPVLWHACSKPQPGQISLRWILLPWALVSFAACKAGSGPWHYAPLLPAVTLVLAQAIAAAPSFDLRRLFPLAALGLLVLIEARQQLPRTLHTYRQPDHIRVRDDLNAFLARHPQDTIAIGSAWSRRPGAVDLALFLPELGRSGHSLLFSEQSFVWLNNTRKHDLLVQQLIQPDRVRFWINAAGPPFGTHLYHPVVQTEFLKYYHLVESTPELMVWERKDATNRLD